MPAKMMGGGKSGNQVIPHPLPPLWGEGGINCWGEVAVAVSGKIQQWFSNKNKCSMTR